MFIAPIGGQIRTFHQRMREEGDSFYRIHTEKEPIRIAATKDGLLDYDGQKIIKKPEQFFKFRQETLTEPVALHGSEPPYVLFIPQRLPVWPES